MRPFSFARLTLVAIAAIFLYSCTDKKEEFVTEPLADYFPLQTGKYITYRVDSLTFGHFNSTVDTQRYQIRHVVDAKITDNLGRPSYRIYTYINDSTASGAWRPNGSYMITASAFEVEVIEDNFRFIKLHAPLRDGYNWLGNSYLPSSGYEPLGYKIANNADLRKWNYFYDLTSSSFTYRNKTYDDVITIQQNDFDNNDRLPIIPDTLNTIASANIGEERYSKNIGLVYKKYVLWEYQNDLTVAGINYYGFGVTMWMIDHN